MRRFTESLLIVPIGRYSFACRIGISRGKESGPLKCPRSAVSMRYRFTMASRITQCSFLPVVCMSVVMKGFSRRTSCDGDLAARSGPAPRYSSQNGWAHRGCRYSAARRLCTRSEPRELQKRLAACAQGLPRGCGLDREPKVSLDPWCPKLASVLAHISVCYVARRPDRLVLSTPHGLELSNDWAMYLNSHAYGVARIGIATFPFLCANKALAPACQPCNAECLCVGACGRRGLARPQSPAM